MEEFDNLVQKLLTGDILLAEFDSGLVLSADTETLGICLDTDDGIIDITISNSELDFLHLFLEAMFVARGEIRDVNWDQFLIGLSEGK